MNSPISLPRLRVAASSSAVSDINFLLFILRLLLSLSGDVEVNPGPLDQGKYQCGKNISSFIHNFNIIVLLSTEDEEILSRVDARTFGECSTPSM